MSRIGKQPIELPAGTTVKVEGNLVSATGKLGTLTQALRPEVNVEVNEGDKVVTVGRINDSKNARAMHGLYRSLIQNMVEGVDKGYIKELEVNGVGYNAQLQGKTVNLKLGYADIRTVTVPDGITVEINSNQIKVSGISKQLVGQVAASIRAHRKPEPYNGKGIKYKDEIILRKAGKAFGGGG